jgi:hypothetical protein
MEWSCGWNQKNLGPLSQQVWHDKDPSLLKGPESLAYMLKFCSSSQVMVTSPYKWKILEWDVFDDLRRTRSHGYNLNLFCQKLLKKKLLRNYFQNIDALMTFYQICSYGDFAHPSELEIIDIADRLCSTYASYLDIQTLKRASTPKKRTVPFHARNEPYCAESEPYRARNEPLHRHRYDVPHKIKAVNSVA